MTVEQISLIAIVVSLLSTLIAAWSLRESKEARSENKKLTISFRKTEALTILIDTTNKGYQVLNEIHDCFEKILQLDISKNAEIQDEIKQLTEKKEKIFTKINELDKKKQVFMDASYFNIIEIEEMKSVSYAQFKAWENDIVLINKIYKKIENIEPPSVYEQRGVITI